MGHEREPSGIEITRRRFIMGAALGAALYGRRYPNVKAAEDTLISGIGSIALDAIKGDLSPKLVATHPTKAAEPAKPTIETSGEKYSLNVIRYPWNDRVPPVAKENWQAKYITMHFTVGPANPNRVDLTSYHFVFAANGSTHECQSTVQHQAPPPGYDDIVEWQMYAPHTSHANTKNIGLSLCGAMTPIPDKNVPVFTPAALESMVKMAAYQAKANKIPADKDHIKTHYQWAQYFEKKGIATENTGKTDITQIPWLPTLNTPEKVHDYLLTKIKEYMKHPLQLTYV